MEEMLDPGPVLQALTAYWVSGALEGALSLDLFTRIGQGARTAEALAEASQASVRGTRILADAMCSLGFLTKDGEQYALTPVADTFMRRDRPAFLAGFHRFVASQEFWTAFSLTGVAARTGRGVMDRNAITPENEMWVTFAETSLPMAMGATQPIVPVLEATRPGLRILDVAAGSGGYGITLAKASPGAQLTLLDWPNVLEVGVRHARAMGLENVQTRPGSAMEVDWGGPYDIVVMGNFFHHFGADTCVDIARRAHAALAPGGLFATTEFVADPQRKAPGMPLLFAVAMLVWTDEGNAYTLAELTNILERAGFGGVRSHPGDPSTWIVARKG